MYEQSHCRTRMSQKEVNDKCLAILQKANSDNEKFAALMLVAKLLQKDETAMEDVAFRNTLLEAVDFKFILKLIYSENSPAGCEPGIFKSIAFSVLSYFSQYSATLTKEHYVKLSNHIRENVSETPDERCFNDMLVVLLGMSRDAADVLVSSSLLPALCNISQSSRLPDPQKVLTILSHTLQSCDLSTLCDDDAVLLCETFMHILKQKNDSCLECVELFNFLLGSFGDVEMRANALIEGYFSKHGKALCSVLLDILKNKLGIHQKRVCLQLTHSIVGLIGTYNLLLDEAYSQSLCLLCHLTCVEVRLILESQDETQIVGAERFLSSYFSFLESIVTTLGSCTGGSTRIRINSSLVLKLREPLIAVMKSVLFFFSTQAEQRELSLTSVIGACIRLFGSWIAVETESISPSELTDILPFLLQECQPMLMSGEDIFKFLLPGLSYASVEESVCAVVLERSEFLEEYLCYLCAHLDGVGQSGTEASLLYWSGVLLSSLVTCPHQSRERAHGLLKSLRRSAGPLRSGLSSSNKLEILTNIATLGILLAKMCESSACINESLDFIGFCIQHLLQAHTQKGVRESWTTLWPGVQDIWHLGIAALEDLMTASLEVNTTLMRNHQQQLTDALKGSGLDDQVAHSYNSILSIGRALQVG